jgi:hypothetical protein
VNFRPVAGQTSVVINCELWLLTANSGWLSAIASAAQPESITESNWTVVAVGSKVKWTQVATFPNAAAP